MECEDQDTQQRDPKTHEMYLNVMRRFSQALLKVMPLCKEVLGDSFLLKRHECLDGGQLVISRIEI